MNGQLVYCVFYITYTDDYENDNLLGVYDSEQAATEAGKSLGLKGNEVYICPATVGTPIKNQRPLRPRWLA